MATVEQNLVVAFPGHTLSDLLRLQQADPDLAGVFMFWRQNKQPSSGERPALSKLAQLLLQQWDHLVEREGVVYRHIFHSDGGEEVLQLVLPSALRKEVLTQVHQQHGHQGGERTVELLHA